MIQRNAYAKINLCLDVVRRLENGYHEVDMIMQQINLYDEIRLEKGGDCIVLHTDHKEGVPEDDRNLMVRAAYLMREKYGLKQGIQLWLKKEIPVAAGLAGGSTDAAAVMLGMRELFELEIPTEELMELGLKIGADVPFCILGGTARAAGIGEKLKSLPCMPACTLLVAKPDLMVSTKYVYEHLRLHENTIHPDVEGMEKSIEDGKLQGVLQRMGNVLQEVTATTYPVVSEILQWMEGHGATRALMSGSGPTVFGIYEEKESACHAKELLMKTGLAKQVYVTWPHIG